jgi:hypothetical protein
MADSKANDEHGFVKEVHCSRISPTTSFECTPEQRRQSQMVGVLIYKGEVKKVFCAQLKTGNCWARMPLEECPLAS